MTAPSTILCVGRLYCDLIFTDLPRMPTLGTEVFAGDVGLHPGGGAPITAAHLSALGHPSALASILPAPPFGEIVRQRLERENVDLNLCQTAKQDSKPQVTMALVHQGERAFVSHRAGPALPEIRADDLRDNGICHIHIGEATTLTDHPNLIDIAKDIGATLSLDCSWDDDLNASKLAPLLREVDVFLPNEAEFQMLKKLGLKDPFGKLTVVKQGAAGAMAFGSQGRVYRPAIKTEIVDTTGAGDAFNAGFLKAWTENAALNDCVLAGNLAGAKATTIRGGMPSCALESAG
ncbi:sugar kinase [Shimia sp.]|uniref:carbohydrate kinase family protein n=1 Tax=Shimia sp. TaxID=1954381 RepID=UPI003296E92D